MSLAIWLLLLIAAELGLVVWHLWRLNQLLSGFKQELDAGVAQASQALGPTV